MTPDPEGRRPSDMNIQPPYTEAEWSIDTGTVRHRRRIGAHGHLAGGSLCNRAFRTRSHWAKASSDTPECQACELADSLWKYRHRAAPDPEAAVGALARELRGEGA